MSAGLSSVRALAAALYRLPARVLMLPVKAYRLLLKPWLGNACRFEPSCSAYTLQALQRHGATGGALLGGWRLLRCQPWCNGGCDPVPDHHPLGLPLRGLFTRFTAPSIDPQGSGQAGAEVHDATNPNPPTASAAVPATDAPSTRFPSSS